MPPIFSVSEIPCDCVIIETQDSLIPSNVIQCLNIYFQFNVFTTELLILLPKFTLPADLLIPVDGNSVLLGFWGPSHGVILPSFLLPHLATSDSSGTLLASPSTRTQSWTTSYHLNNFRHSLLSSLSGLLQSPPNWSPSFYPCLLMVSCWHWSHKGSVKTRLLLT